MRNVSQPTLTLFLPRVELHIYAAGGHGFALWPHGLPSDSWIDHFWTWLQAEEFVPVPS